MRWGEIPYELLDASAHIRKAQENLEKMVHDEIDRQVKFACSEWRRKVYRLVSEREQLRTALESSPTIFSQAALKRMEFNDLEWFPGMTARDYAKALEYDSSMGR